MHDHEKTTESQSTDAGNLADRGRRRFLRDGALLSGCLALGWHTAALAQAKPMLNPGDYQARALDYVQDAENAKTSAGYQSGQHCGNCEFFSASTQVCGLFPDHRVAEEGWCGSWTAGNT